MGLKVEIFLNFEQISRPSFEFVPRKEEMAVHNSAEQNRLEALHKERPAKSSKNNLPKRPKK